MVELVIVAFMSLSFLGGKRGYIPPIVVKVVKTKGLENWHFAKH